jgi:hypothetical protein
MTGGVCQTTVSYTSREGWLRYLPNLDWSAQKEAPDRQPELLPVPRPAVNQQPSPVFLNRHLQAQEPVRHHIPGASVYAGGRITRAPLVSRVKGRKSRAPCAHVPVYIHAPHIHMHTTSPLGHVPSHFANALPCTHLGEFVCVSLCVCVLICVGLQVTCFLKSYLLPFSIVPPDSLSRARSLSLARVRSRFLYACDGILQPMWTGGVVLHTSAVLVYDQGTCTDESAAQEQHQNTLGGDAFCADMASPKARHGVRTGRIVTDIRDPRARERKFSYV